jgi:hypothetical protein
MPEIMIFKAGKYPQGDWPKERVQKMVDAYNPEKSYEAPVVIGHRFWTDTDEGQYAHGWVKSLRMDGTGKVYADIEFIDDAKKAIAEKKLRYISAEICELDKVDETQPPYLRAVALLGRDTPQIPSARLPTLFGLITGGTVVTIDEEQHIAAFTRKVSGDDISAVDAQETSITKEENKMDELEKLKAEVTARDARLAAFQQENEELKHAGKHADAVAFFGKLRDEGKLPPALFEKTVSLDAKLETEDRTEFRALFSELKETVDLSGTHIANKNKAPPKTDTSLTAKIRAFQTERKLASFTEASEVLYAERPELFEAGGEP